MESITLIMGTYMRENTNAASAMEKAFINGAMDLYTKVALSMIKSRIFFI
jgi:hypothetical protein